ncbi:hypothetical protein ASC77_19995 [Nocardioides sp. Root1257]|uniref:hypothetical protein n=1 Tax=unclassified Nocardioides TaxID=2615069 RepID=UPI0006F644F4|nr:MULTISPECIES: hypothetical protein [unclassified Nocardioides]KQW45066.1 hypothetical protein ASC77_19995 [Nocardioides sp. Root1257]KRC45930.1 hypothetical protein ASE24_15225 [Nocardioides sp. Root224]
MLHAFVDESYTNDWFFIAAALGDDQQVTTLNNNMPWLVIEAAESFQLATVPNELHGYELLQGIGPWRVMPLHDRLDIEHHLGGVPQDARTRVMQCDSS